MNKSFKLLLFLILWMISTNVQAQFAVGVGVGTTTYWGDLNSPNNISNIQNNSGIGVNVNFVKNINRLLDLKGAIILGTIKGADSNSTLEWQKTRNLSFSSYLLDVSTRLNVKLFNWNIGGSKVLTPYLSYGFSMFFFNPKATYQGKKYGLRDLGTEGQGMAGFGEKYNQFDMSINTGGGASLRLNDKFSIVFDISLYKTFTDYIDDVGRYYVASSELSQGNGELASIFGDRTPEYLGTGEPSTKVTGQARGGISKDYFITSMLGVMIDIDTKDGLFGSSKIKCPKF